jgi:hypothetical protein
MPSEAPVTQILFVLDIFSKIHPLQIENSNYICTPNHGQTRGSFKDTTR